MCGVSGEDLKGGFLVDEKGPEIVVNSEKASLNVMAGVPIPVPTATAYDVNGIAGKVDYSVYYGYGTSFQKSIVVKNGILVPSELGTYTIIYTARDVFGNTAEKTLTLNAVKEGEQGIDFTCEKVTEAVAGNFISLDNYSAKSLNTTATVTVSGYRSRRQARRRCLRYDYDLRSRRRVHRHIRVLRRSLFGFLHL